MNKLELKHINPYADKSLKGLFHGVEDIVTGIDYEFVIISSLNNGSVLIRDFKPLLHPLERLTMPELKEYGPEYQYHEETLRVVLSAAKNGSVMRLNYDFVDFLFSKHFDVFGLIEKGLAEPIKIHDEVQDLF